jgi:chromosome segregation ATPase
MSLAEVSKERGKKEVKTLENHTKPRLSELLGGKVGTVLYEGLSIVESGAKAGRTALEKKLNERIDNVSNEASAASGAARSAESSAGKAATSAKAAQEKADAASTSAAEVEAKATAMADDVAKVTGDASAAKKTADEAKTAADRASADVSEIKGALTATLKSSNGSEEKETLTGKKTVEFVIGKLAKLSTSVAGFLDRLAKSEKKQEELEAGLNQLRSETEGTLELYMGVLQMNGLLPSQDDNTEGGNE